MLGAGEDALGEGVGEGFFRHHAAGEGVDAPGLDGGVVRAAAGEDKGGGGVEDLHLGPQPGRGLGEAVVDFGEFRAEAADVDGAIGICPRRRKSLSITSSSWVLPRAKRGITTAPPRAKAAQIAAARRFSSPARVKPGGGLVVAAGGLDDQDIDARSGKRAAREMVWSSKLTSPV